MIDRRQFVRWIAVSAGSAAIGVIPVARAQRMGLARILVGFPPGGGSDGLSRLVAAKMNGHYADRVIVENKPGAAGQIAVLALKDSPADGTALLLTPASALVIYPYTYPKLAYKPFDDTTPVCVGAYMHHGFGVGPLVPATIGNLKEFLAWAKANPERANFASPGAGSMPHLIGALLERASGVALNHVPYRGSAPGIQDLLGGQIAAMSSPMGDYLPHLQSGRLRLLALAGEKRSALAPQIPTYAEQGFAELTMREWFGFFLPGKARPDVVRAAFGALRDALRHPDVVDGLAKMGLEAAPSASPEEFAQVVNADHDLWAPFVKRIGFRAES